MSKEAVLYALLILLAAMLDGAQFFIGLGISGASFAISSLFGWIPVAGQVLAGATSGVGVIIGATIDICLSFSFGSMIDMLLIYFGLANLRVMVGGSLFESLPFVDILPGWTAMVAVCIWKKHFGNKGVLGAAAEVATGTAVAGAGGMALSGAHANNNQHSISNSGAKMHISNQMNGDIRPKLSHAA